MPDKWGGIIYWHAAATYHAGEWWPVLEVPISGIPPYRVTKYGFSNFLAAYSRAQEIVKGVDSEAMRYLIPHKLEQMKENTDEGKAVPSD